MTISLLMNKNLKRSPSYVQKQFWNPSQALLHTTLKHSYAIRIHNFFLSEA